MDALTPEEIRAIRKRLDLTQEQFAQLIGVTVFTVGGWERGEHVPSPLSLRMLRTVSATRNSERGTT